MDRLSSMATYVKTVESGSFAAAATALGISPQMVAKHVGYLETRLGTRLLNRTPGGRALLRSAGISTSVPSWCWPKRTGPLQ
jgi:DNA-binding transcriptional LysR family regulator